MPIANTMASIHIKETNYMYIYTVCVLFWIKKIFSYIARTKDTPDLRLHIGKKNEKKWNL